MAIQRWAYTGRGKRQKRATGWLDAVPFLPVILVAFGVGGLATFTLRETGMGNWFAATPTITASYSNRSFPICAGGARVTCVVDGDTFWLDGVKIRIADINTPEIGSPQCAAEAALGQQATQKLRQLLNGGDFSLARIDRDEDQYGRKLRIVLRDGQSIGDMLVAEGLAHEWRGRRESWC